MLLLSVPVAKSNTFSNTAPLSPVYHKTHHKFSPEEVQYGKVARTDLSADPDRLFTVQDRSTRNLCKPFVFFLSFYLTEINEKTPTNFDGNKHQITSLCIAVIILAILK